MIWIRADGNGEIGIGHIMRCISVAEEIQRMGEEVCFVLADEGASELLREKKQKFLVLNTEYNQMETELGALEDLIREYNPDLFLVDSYSATPRYLEQLRKNVKTAYMDDSGTSFYPVNILINYNVYATKAMYEQNTDGVERFLLGAQYAPLRKEFRVEGGSVCEEVKNIFISTGGSDKYNLTGKILDCMMRDKKMGKLNYHVVCGRFNVHWEELEQKAKQNPNIYIYKNATNMADIMRRCDLGISAAGSTMYEMAALNIPGITFSFADNQKKAVEAFGNRQAAVSVGHYEPTGEKEFMESVVRSAREMCGNDQKRMDVAGNAHDLVDGQGAKRIAEALVQYCEAL